MDRKKIKTLYWEKGNTVAAIARKLNVSIWSLYDFMDKNGIPRRSYAEANYVATRDKPRFEIRNIIGPREEKLKVAGSMLYWAEGTLKRSTIDFANSDPRMIKLFLKFLREICGVREERLRLYLYT